MAPKGGVGVNPGVMGSTGPLVSLKGLQNVPKGGICVTLCHIGIHRALGVPKGPSECPQRWDLCHPMGYWGPQAPWCP